MNHDALTGSAIGSIRRIRFGADAQAAATCPGLDTIEIETKRGRHFHFLAKPDQGGVALMEGAARPPDDATQVRLSDDLTASFAPAFDGRPVIVAVHPATNATGGAAEITSAWTIELSNGVRLCCHAGPAGAVDIATEPVSGRPCC